MFDLQKSSGDQALVRSHAPSVQRKCACGQHTMAGGKCEACRRKDSQASGVINEPGDRFEREADQMAAAVVRGGRAPSLSAGGAAVKRQAGSKKPKSNEEKMKEAGKKAAEAFMKTKSGQEIEKKAKAMGESFVSTLHGKVITGAAVAGVLSTLVATNKELPAQLPEIPLEKLQPGLSMKITWEGPVRTPKAGSITFTYKFGAGRRERREKPKLTRAEKQRAENARMARELHEFREGLKSPEQRAREQQQMMDALARMRANDPLNPFNISDLKPRSQALPLLPRREREEEPVQRKEKRGFSATVAGGHIPPSVQETVKGGGQPLDPATRTTMESRFNHDFSSVRIHADERAARSAADIDAQAYTTGGQIVFGAGQYSPQSSSGQALLAHELTHVVQQGAAGPTTMARRHHPPAATTLPTRGPSATSRAARRKSPASTFDRPGKQGKTAKFKGAVP